ncbi:MAG: hypothetical protein ACRCR2_07920 [Fusobacteriaceae bacterium]
MAKVKAKKDDLYSTKIKPKLRYITKWRADGETISGIAKKLGIARCTFYNYMQDKPELMEALAEGKVKLDTDLQISALKRAKGYIQKTKKIVHKKNSEGEIIETTEEIAEKFIYSDVLMTRMLNSGFYDSDDKMPTELKELMEDAEDRVREEHE